MKREIGHYIQDVIDAMRKGMKFVEGMEYEDFIGDDKTVFAVIRAMSLGNEIVQRMNF